MKRSRQALRGHAAFSRVFATGKRIDGILVRCFVVVESGEAGKVNVGYAISSRSYEAVRRNRIRRLMREAFAREFPVLQQALLDGRKSASVIFAFKSSTAVDVRRLKVHPLSADFAQLCRKVAAMA